MLTMFAMVLAIGLLVDDAIVVVENVERLMAEEGLSPKEATRKSMEQITGALIGIATVLSAVFMPMAFLTGSTGVIYRQFSITIVSAMVLSVIVAHRADAGAVRDAAQAGAERRRASRQPRLLPLVQSYVRCAAAARYQSAVGRMIARPWRYMIVYLALASLMGLLFLRLPTAFLPDEDQGYLFMLVQTPVGATLARTQRALDQVRGLFPQPGESRGRSVFTVAGFSFSGAGQNAGIGFVLLKDWSERKSAKLSVSALQERAYRSR